MWFILVDAYSKWPEVVQLSTTTATKTVSVLRTIFSKMGIPNQIVTDNGPQFTTFEFVLFFQNNHTLTALYHPSSNGKAECFVQTFKQTIVCRKRRECAVDLETSLVLIWLPKISCASDFPVAECGVVL